MTLERLTHGLERRVRRLKTRLAPTRPSIRVVQKRFDGGSIVGCEVGVFRGKHSKQMLKALPNLTRLYLVDPYTMYEGYTDFKNPSTALLEAAECEAHACLDRYKDRVVWVRDKFKAEHIPESLDFIYIDGQHTYEAVTHDILQAILLVKPGGIIAGHDYYPVGHRLNKRFRVGTAVRAFFGANHRWKLNDWWTILDTSIHCPDPCSYRDQDAVICNEEPHNCPKNRGTTGRPVIILKLREKRT